MSTQKNESGPSYFIKDGIQYCIPDPTTIPIQDEMTPEEVLKFLLDKGICTRCNGQVNIWDDIKERVCFICGHRPEQDYPIEKEVGL